MGRRLDLIGKTFGQLTVLEFVGTDEAGTALWRCKCSCGNECVRSTGNLRSAGNHSCGCVHAPESLIGRRFGKLTVLAKAEPRREPNGHLRQYWKCQCDCGNIVEASGKSLRSGAQVSCGCLKYDGGYKRQYMAKSLQDLTGQRFGKLVVIARAEDHIYPSGHHRKCWLCQCDCGQQKIVSSINLTSGTTRSCGCICSAGEEAVAKALDLFDLSYKRQFSFSDFVGENGHKYKYDFGVFRDGQLSYLIEYDGSQHYEYHNNGWDDKGHFEKTKKRDRIKDEYACKQGIPLIRLPYDKIDLNSINLNDLLPETSRFLISTSALAGA